MELGLDGAIKRLKLRCGVSGGLRVDVNDVTVLRVEVHVGCLELVEALRKQAGADEEHQGERGLHDDKAALQEGCSRGDVSRTRAQRFCRLRLGGDPGRRYAEQDAGEERKGKSKADHQG